MRTCNKCGTTLADLGSGGLCPVCFLAEGLTPEEPAVPPAPGGAPEPGVVPAGGADWGPGDIAGQRLGDYELLEEIARGGMGVVYKARQHSLNRVVALKMILAGQLATRPQVERFRAEAEAAASLQHPNIVAIHEVGEDQGRHFFSMDYVQGRSLAGMVRDGPLPARGAARYVRTLAGAVQYAHGRGIIHRDLKPSNVLIDQNDEPRITDFGLAKRLSSDSDLTLSGQVVGSPSYLSPEQAAGKGSRVGPASDVYALGAILYHLLTGRPPFQAESLTTLLKEVLEAEPVGPRRLNASIPRDLETICLKCLEKDPAGRYGTAQALGDDLGRYLNSEPIQARAVGMLGRGWRWCRRKPALAGALAACLGILVLGVAGIAWQYQRAVASEHQTRLGLYAADMSGAQQAITENNRDRALQLLESHRPRKGEADLRGWDWRYLRQRCKGDELETIRAHQSAGVSDAKFSPDGTWFATRGGDKVVIRETSSKRLLAVLYASGGESASHGVQVSPDGRMLAVHVADGIEVRSCTNWSLLHKLEDGQAPMAFSADASLLAARCRHPNKVRVWKTQTWNSELHEAGFLDAYNPGYASGMVFLPQSHRLAVHLTVGFLIRLLDLSISADSPASAPRGLSSTAPVRPGIINSAVVNLAGTRLATTDRSGKIDLWSLPDFQHLGRIAGQSGDVQCAAFSPDGTKLAAGGGDTAIRLYDVATQTNLVVYHGHRDVITDLQFSPDGRRLLSASMDGACKFWDSAPEAGSREVRIGRGCWYRGGQCCFSDDGQQLITFTTNRLPELRSFEREVFVGSPRRLLTNLAEVTSVSMDARTAMMQTTDERVEVWDIPSETRIGVLKNPLIPGATHSFLVSPDSRFLYQSQLQPGGNTGHLWDLNSGRLLKTFEDKSTWSMAFSSDSRFLARGFAGEAELWDVAGGRTLHRLRGHIGEVCCLAFSPDGRLVATGSWGKEVCVWDVASGKRVLGPLRGHQQLVTKAAFTPDGRTLLTFGDENVLRVWNLATGRETAKYAPAGCFTLSPDGGTVAVWWYGRLRLLHVPTLEELDTAEKAAAERDEASRRELEAAAQRSLMARAQDAGGIRQWLLLAPIPFTAPDSAAALQQEQIPREASLRPRAGQRLKAGGVQQVWRAVRLENDLLDFNQLLGKETARSVAYAVCYIHSETPRAGLLLKVGSDDQAKVYLNGKAIYTCERGRSYTTDEDVVPGVELKAGLNVLLFKVVNETSDWQGSVRFTDATGQPVKGIKTQLAP
jgi:eukaryotic-like serine/threonine-protein kinase